MTQVWAVFGTYSSVVDVASTVWAKWGTDVVRWAAIGNGKYKRLDVAQKSQGKLTQVTESVGRLEFKEEISENMASGPDIYLQLS